MGTPKRKKKKGTAGEGGREAREDFLWKGKILAKSEKIFNKKHKQNGDNKREKKESTTERGEKGSPEKPDLQKRRTILRQQIALMADARSLSHTSKVHSRPQEPANSQKRRDRERD